MSDTATAAKEDVAIVVSRRRYLAVFALIYAVHLGMMAYSFPVDDLIGGRPFASPDYQTHFRQTTVLTRVVERFGKLWAYDPGMLAGHPVGLIFDVDNKAHFLFSYALHKAGLKLGAAFNLFTVVSCLLAPLSLWFAGRMFRLRPNEQLWTLAFGVLLWHLDSSGSAWRGGMISFSTASHLSLAVLGLFYRLAHAEEQRDRWRYLLPLLLLLPLTLLTHVWSFAILVVPMVGLYLRSWRRLGRGGHLSVWGLALFSLGANMYWLYPALLHHDLISSSGVVGQANPLYIISDWFDLLVSPINTGFSIPHTLFRFAAICGAALSLWRWRRERDDRYFIAALTLGYLFFMAYAASLIPLLKETEPYRFVLPGSLAAGIFGAVWWARTCSVQRWKGVSRPIKACVVVLLILLLPRVVEHLTYFYPEIAPSAQLPPIVVRRTAAAPTTTLPREVRGPDWLPQTYRMRSAGKNILKLARYLETECTEEGRVLVQHWAVAEFLGWATDKPVIGGFPDRRLIHEAANLLRRPTDPRFHGQELANYLVRYNIRYLVLTNPVPALEKRRDLLEPKGMVFPNRVYRVRHTANYVARGSGKVRAGLNRIEVTKARPAPNSQSMLLRFHHMSSLHCRPNCKVLRTKIPHDPVGFITVVGQPRLPESFVIEHRYD